jgi:hypothetical protein
MMLILPLIEIIQQICRQRTVLILHLWIWNYTDFTRYLCFWNCW